MAVPLIPPALSDKPSDSRQTAKAQWALVPFKRIDMTMGLRVTEVQEREGLDAASHGERSYNL